LKIDTRNPVALGMLVVGVLLMAATLVYSKLVPAPDAKAAVDKQDHDVLEYKKDAKNKTVEAANRLASIQTRLWSDSDDVIAPKTLKILTDLAATHGLKVSSFRPQKETAAGALMILPFFVSLDGPFPNVGAYLRDFEEHQQSLIVNNVQIASSDQNTHAVSASIEVSAYIDPNRDAAAAKLAVTAQPFKTLDKPGKSAAGANALNHPAGRVTPGTTKPTQTPGTKQAAHSDRGVPRGAAKA